MKTLQTLFLSSRRRRNIPRRAFLSPLFLLAPFFCAIAGLALGAAADATPGASPSVRQPHLLLIMPDQMRGDCLSRLGHPVVRTPHIDQLADQGTLFSRAYSTVPSCIPARYSLLTGLYPQTSGVVGFFQRPLPATTLPRVLSDAGYRTILVGRNMHQRENPERKYPAVSGGMKLIFFGRFETHGFCGGFSSAASRKKVFLRRVDFLPS